MITTKTLAELKDDLDGTVGGTVATRSFALGDDARLIELTQENWDKLVEVLGPWLAKSRKASKVAVRKGRKPVQLATDEQRKFNQRVREWAISEKLIDATRGRLSEELKDKYRAAMMGMPETASPQFSDALTRDQIPAF